MTVFTGEHELTPSTRQRERANPYFLDHLIRQVIVTANPSRIVLFGSRAKRKNRAEVCHWDLFVETDMPAQMLLGRVQTPPNVIAAIDRGITLYDRSQHHVQTWLLKEGADGTFQALALMASAVRGEGPPDYSGYQDEFNIRAAGDIISAYTAYTGISQYPVAALFYFCRDQIEYLDHPFNTQQVQDCRRTLEKRSGDCVSKSVCLATLLATQGVHSRFVAQCPDGEEYSHVYVEAWLSDAWVSLDPVASGTGNRPLGGIGWRQPLSDGSFESTQEIF